MNDINSSLKDLDSKVDRKFTQNLTWPFDVAYY